MKKKNVKNEFEDVYTEFQCMIIAQLNKFNFQGISATQYNIVDFVLKNGSSTTGQLAKAFHISAPAISRQVKILLEKKLVMLTRDQADRRTYHITATAKGKRLVNDSSNLRRTMANEIARILSKEELTAFSTICKKILNDIKI